jgi:superfamily II DNA helicase RecQ
MRELGSFVRQVSTQTVWLTATLPPSLEPVFMERNLLVRPRIIRESTNRPNIRYSIRRYSGSGTLCEKALELVRPYEAMIREFDEGDGRALPRGQRARIIMYCQTINLMRNYSQFA